MSKKLPLNAKISIVSGLCESLNGPPGPFGFSDFGF